WDKRQMLPPGSLRQLLPSNHPEGMEEGRLDGFPCHRHEHRPVLVATTEGLQHTTRPPLAGDQVIGPNLFVCLDRLNRPQTAKRRDRRPRRKAPPQLAGTRRPAAPWEEVIDRPQKENHSRDFPQGLGV